MAFCKLSSELIQQKHTLIENNFITEFLPNINPLAAKVYIYGLYLCQSGEDNSLENFTKTFSLSEDDVVSLFKNLEELNLVDVIEATPLHIRFLPVKNSSMFLKKYNVKKYKTFNVQVQAPLKRLVDINELNQYYYQIEKNNMEPEAVVAIVEFCVFKKGDNVSANYVLTVLRNWAREGIKTKEDVDERINNEERFNEDFKTVLVALGIRRAGSMEEKDMFLNWVNNLGFNLETLVHLAKIAKKKRSNFFKLNALVNKSYELSMFSPKEIDDYFVAEEEYFNIAKSVCRNLGVYYDNLDIVVESYIINWANLGYDGDALTKLSLYCFKSGIKNLQGLDSVVNKMYKLGVVTAEAIDKYINELNSFDSQIKEILNEFELGRNVNKFDRAFYNTWINTWKINPDVLKYAVSISKNKIQPMQYLNRILSIYHNKNITNVEQAKKEKIEFENYYTPKGNKPTSVEKRQYSKEQLSSLFDNINEVEV